MLKYFLKNWKLGIHLVFRTYHFGVNNEWWVNWRSYFGLPMWKRFFKIRESLVGIRFRIVACHFVPDEEKKQMEPLLKFIYLLRYNRKDKKKNVN